MGAELPPEYDPAVLEKMASLMSREGAAEVVKAIVDDGNRLTGGLTQALQDRDPKGLKLYAHTMRSSSRMVGALALSQLCLDVEETVAAGTIDGVAARAQEALRRYGKLMRDLQPVIAEYAGG